MKLNKYLYNTIVVLLPLMIYFILLVIITKNLFVIIGVFEAIIVFKTYIFWGIIFASYFGIYLLYKKIKYFIFLIPTIIITFTIHEYISSWGDSGIMVVWYYYLPIACASIVYPLGAILYEKLYKSTDDLEVK